MNFLKKTLLTILGLLAGLLFVEGLARLLLPFPKQQIALLRMRAPDLQMDAQTDLNRLSYDPFLQRRPHSFWICDGKQPERMNNEGFRDRDFLLEKRPGVTRIAALGDSFTEGWMAAVGGAFPKVLEQELGPRVEVYNFGLANRSPLRYLATYQKMVRPYHPDVVLVCLYRNDLQEDDTLRPYATFDEQGLPTHFDFQRYYRHTPRMPQTKWEKRWDKWEWYLCQYSRIYPYAAVSLWVDPEFKRRILETPSSEELSKLWKHTEQYLNLLKQSIDEDHARLLITYAPDFGEFTTPHPLLTFVETFCKRHDIPFFDPRHNFASEDLVKLYIPGDGHFSIEGHRLMGKSLANWLSRLPLAKRSALEERSSLP